MDGLLAEPGETGGVGTATSTVDDAATKGAELPGVDSRSELMRCVAKRLICIGKRDVRFWWVHKVLSPATWVDWPLMGVNLVIRWKAGCVCAVTA